MAGTDSESRFDGAGQEFHAKYMGSVEVAKSKGQEACQEAMQKLLTQLKGRKEPKPRMIVNLSYEGTRLKEMPPGINLLDLSFKHSQVSYVWKDPRDQRSLGIVRSEPDPGDEAKVVHKFHGIRTVKPAMPFLQEMQELFRIVKERAAQHKERAGSVAAGSEEVAAGAAAAAAAAGSNGAPATAEAAAAPVATANQQPADANRDRALSNLLGPDQAIAGGHLPKNESVASLDELGDIFSASTTIGQQQQQQPPTSQPMGGGGNPFGQPMGGGGQFGQPTGGGQFGQPMGGGGQFGQPMGGGGQFGQPMGGGGGQFRQPIPGNPFGQPMGGAPPVSSAASTNPFGGPPSQPMGVYGAPTSVYGGYQAPRSPVPFGQQQQHQQQQQQYYYQQQQQQHQQQAGSGTNPFSSVFDRQSSVPDGDSGLLMPVSLNPTAGGSGSAKGDAALKPDAFSDLVVGLPGKADPKRQQVSSKDLFRAGDGKPKTSLRDLANQSPRP